MTPVDPLGKRANPLPDPEKIAALAKLVDGAKAPMIWIGGGAVDAGPEILALAEKIGAPVVSFRIGKGVVDSRHPLGADHASAASSCGRQDRPADRHRHAARRAGGALGAGPGRAEDRAHRHRSGGDRRLTVNVPIVADAAEGTRALTAVGRATTTRRAPRPIARRRRTTGAAIEKAAAADVVSSR